MDAIEARARKTLHKGFADWAATPVDGGAAVRSATGDNPFCGDSIEMRLAIACDGAGEEVIAEAAFDGYACTLCTAAADTLLERVRGMRAADARAVGYDELVALMGIPAPARTRSGCVRLPLTVLARALEPGAAHADGAREGGAR